MDYHYRVMPAQADIIVRSPDSTRVSLVVEAKLRVSNLEQTERQLKNFMLQLRCPVGVLISPDRLWVYLDRFTSDSEESVDRLGEFIISDLISFHAVPAMAGETAAASAFENAVQSWLESLPSSDTRQLVKDVNLRSAIDHYIVPAVENGIVEAAGPR